MKLLTFDKSAREFILDAFDKKTDKEGYIIEKSNGQRIIADDGQELHKSQFGGIRKGSQIYMKKDIISVIKLIDSLK